MNEGKQSDFIVLSSGRSGSTWLVDVLNNIDGVWAYGELFNPKKRSWGVGPADFQRFVESPRGLRPFSVFSYLNDFYGSRDNKVGFKLMYAHLARYPEIWPYIYWRRPQIIHLIRRNHLDVILSIEFAKSRGQFHQLEGQAKAVTGKISFDPDELLHRMRRRQRYIEMAKFMLRLGRLDGLEVYYEDLACGNSAFGPIWDYLGIEEGLHPKSQLVKITTGKHSDLIMNYQEVHMALQGTEFAQFIT